MVRNEEREDRKEGKVRENVDFLENSHLQQQQAASSINEGRKERVKKVQSFLSYTSNVLPSSHSETFLNVLPMLRYTLNAYSHIMSIRYLGKVSVVNEPGFRYCGVGAVTVKAWLLPLPCSQEDAHPLFSSFWP